MFATIEEMYSIIFVGEEIFFIAFKKQCTLFMVSRYVLIYGYIFHIIINREQ